MPIVYPFYETLNDLANNAVENFSQGNFGLWYNKMIPVIHPNNAPDNGAFCACDNSGNKDGKINFYKTIYDNIKKNPGTRTLLEKKHCHQMHYAEYMKEHGFILCSFTAILDTPLITGIGESHPSETSLVIDHTIGIPFIPSSGIKGMVRFAHSKNLLTGNDGNFDDTFVIDYNDKRDGLIRILDEKNTQTHIPLFFGGETATGDGKKTDTIMGKIIFMDVYPVSMPELHEDIINPHYSKYYDDNNEPPGDWHDPVPIKFLTIAPQTGFILRILLDPEAGQYKDQFIKAVKDALETEGIGAKTGTGYGRFKSLSQSVPKLLKDAYEEYIEDGLNDKEKKERKIKKFITLVENTDKNKSNEINRLFDQWRSHENEFMSDNIDIARAFEPKIKKKKARGDFTKYYNIIMDVLGNQPEDDTTIDTGKPDNGDNADQPKKSDTEKNINKTELKLKRIIDKGFCVKKEKKKIIKKYKTDFPDLCLKIKHLPEKKAKRN